MSVRPPDVAPPVSVEQRAGLPSELRALLESVIAHFERRLAVSERRIAELEGELRAARKTTQNSSLPPSAEQPHAKTSGASAVETGEEHVAEGGDAAERKPLKKKRGGQRGHPKHERTLLPLEQCADVVPLKPQRCRGCGEKWRGEAPDPWRHQEWELPPLSPRIRVTVGRVPAVVYREPRRRGLGRSSPPRSRTS